MLETGSLSVASSVARFAALAWSPPSWGSTIPSWSSHDIGHCRIAYGFRSRQVHALRRPQAAPPPYVSAHVRVDLGTFRDVVCEYEAGCTGPPLPRLRASSHRRFLTR